MAELEVAVVGAGPTGLMLASELAQAGVRVGVFERRAEESNITRAFAVHARTLELLDARDMADEVLARGNPMTELAPIPGVVIDLGTADTRYPMVLMVAQSGTEHVLEQRARDLGVDIRRGAEVLGLRQGDDHVELQTQDRTVRAEYVVGCDGAHSAVRRLAGIEFAGTQYETHIMLADVRVDPPEKVPMFARTNQNGLVLVLPYGDGYYRLIAWDLNRQDVPLQQPLTLDELRETFRSVAGDDYGMREPRWMSRFLSERRQAAGYRAGRVFLAGDAAHVHSPIGGQGMNTGIQDAVNLGWKLVAALRGWGPDGLLDTYHAERHPVGASVLGMTDALCKLVLSKSRVRHKVQPTVLKTLLKIPPVRQRLIARGTGLGMGYPSGPGQHKLVGQRAQDQSTPDGRLYELLRAGKFVLIDGTDSGIRAEHVVVAPVEPSVGATAMLVRPDGYVGWATDQLGGQARAEILVALAKWCGVQSKSTQT